MKVLAFYLPQFHETPDNNKWWGEGYTEWVAVKAARQTSRYQRLPRVPLDERYYDLAEKDAATLKWQAELAKKYSIYGFVIYHYWFSGKKELYRPVEILLEHKEIDINYSLCWDCLPWKKTWYGNKSEILVEQDYGDEAVWKEHFMDLLPYFKDERYIKQGNRPVFHIYHSCNMDCLGKMRKVWERLAQENGFDGIFLITENQGQKIIHEDAMYNFEPTGIMSKVKGWYALYINVLGSLNKHTNKFKKFVHNVRNSKRVLRYIESQTIQHNIFAGTFCGYDDSPRRQKNGLIFTTVLPEDFQNNLNSLMCKSRKVDNEYVYINAWNEWGECAYLEPDSEYGYAYLEAVRNAYEAYLQSEE